VTPKGNAFIRSYGLFWRREEINWSPGHGNGKDFRLLGRRGKRYPKLEVADFRDQLGIYVLHDDYGAYYVGLARDRSIAKRLKDHTKDTHKDNWDRFSWFGFRGVLSTCDANGLMRLGKMPQTLLTDSRSTIGDIEALLMVTLGTTKRGNTLTMKFKGADRWEQIAKDETQTYYRLIASPLYQEDA